jgi:hypothetical protein
MFRLSIKSQFKYFPAVILFIVFVMGFNIGLTMVRPPEFLPRKPSSINQDDGPIVNELATSALVQLDCGETARTITTDTALVRFKGCLGETGIPTEVINLTTGYAATVIDANNAFTTDYFQLSTGTNLISVTYLMQSGEAKIFEYRIRVK